MTLYPYRELIITSKVQECCAWEFAAKLGEFGYSSSSNNSSRRDTSGKAVAMKLLMIMPKLLLQKEHMKAKKKENDKAFRRRMEAWQKGEYLELMEEAEAIRKRLTPTAKGWNRGNNCKKIQKQEWKKEMCIRQEGYYHPNKVDYFRLTKRPQKN